MGKVTTIAEMDLAGGAACLDLVNTSLEFDAPVERLHSYRDLLLLTRRLSLLDEDTLAALERLAEEDPRQAERALLKAREVRQSMLLVFTALARGPLKQATAQDLNRFNGHIQEALGKRGFRLKGDKLEMGWENPQKDLLQAVWVFSFSAYAVLTTHDYKLIKQCGGCSWFFLDETKNHRRKWCDMQTCGTNEKARRYYQRKKQASASSVNQ